MMAPRPPMVSMPQHLLQGSLGLVLPEQALLCCTFVRSLQHQIVSHAGGGAHSRHWAGTPPLLHWSTRTGPPHLHRSPHEGLHSTAWYCDIAQQCVRQGTGCLGRWDLCRLAAQSTRCLTPMGIMCDTYGARGPPPTAAYHACHPEKTLYPVTRNVPCLPAPGTVECTQYVGPSQHSTVGCL